MENASKALIIAGAILLSILIIGLGMAVFNSSDQAKGSASLDESETRAHNSKFLAYEGKQVGSSVSALINAIKTNNKQYSDRQIKIYYSNTTSKAPGFDSHTGNIAANSNDVNGNYANISGTSIRSRTTYYVNFHTGDNGIIDACDIHVYSNAD